MSSISRRTLLGYSGTTAAGIAFGTSGTAEAASAEEAQAASSEFPEGTLFRGSALLNDVEGYLNLEFSVSTNQTGAQDIDPVEIAELLSDLAAARGWPAVTFYGTPKPAPLN